MTNIENEFVDPAKYWLEDLTWSPPKAYWVDPYPSFMGMLSSDLIRRYNKLLDGRMIDPFQEANLKPASYEMTLGPLYYINGDRKTLTEDEPWLTLPRNSIVFVSMRERIALPHYIAARFDLAIEFIYQGILLGTGPQVDPGFHGVLSCPLHNISDGDINLRYGYPFAKIDFAKTSGLMGAYTRSTDSLRRRKRPVSELQTEKELYDHEIFGEGDERVALFKTGNRWREPIFANDYTGRRKILSSLGGLEDRVRGFGGAIDEFDEEIGRVRRFGLAAGLAVVFAMIAILITLSQLDRSYTDAKIDSVRVQPTESARTLNALRDEIAALRARLAELEQALTEQDQGNSNAGVDSDEGQTP